jgi:hypothetical protein
MGPAVARCVSIRYTWITEQTATAGFLFEFAVGVLTRRRCEIREAFVGLPRPVLPDARDHGAPVFEFVLHDLFDSGVCAPISVSA